MMSAPHRRGTWKRGRCKGGCANVIIVPNPDKGGKKTENFLDVAIGSSLPQCSPVSTPGRKEVDPVLHKSVFEARFRARVIKDTELSAAAPPHFERCPETPKRGRRAPILLWRGTSLTRCSPCNQNKVRLQLNQTTNNRLGLLL